MSNVTCMAMKEVSQLDAKPESSAREREAQGKDDRLLQRILPRDMCCFVSHCFTASSWATVCLESIAKQCVYNPHIIIPGHQL